MANPKNTRAPFGCRLEIPADRPPVIILSARAAAQAGIKGSTRLAMPLHLAARLHRLLGHRLDDARALGLPLGTEAGNGG